MNFMAWGGQSLEHSPHFLHLEASMRGFAAIIVFIILVMNGGSARLSHIVFAFLKSFIMSGSTFSPNIVISVKLLGPMLRSFAIFTVGTVIGSKLAIVTAT